MGGFGSGPQTQGKPTTADCFPLDIRRFRREGFLNVGRIFGWQRQIDGHEVDLVVIRVEPQRLLIQNRPVTICWTRCTYGGGRVWFRCPRCDRRTAIIYRGSSWDLGCRKCLRLAYESQRLSPRSRAMETARSIRRRLGGTADLTADFPPKPKGMHQTTYKRLKAKAEDAERVIWGYWGSYVTNLQRRFGSRA